MRKAITQPIGCIHIRIPGTAGETPLRKARQHLF